MTTADPRVVPEVHEHESQNEEANENDDEDGETPDKPDGEDHEMGGGDASRARHSSDERNAQKHKKTCM